MVQQERRQLVEGFLDDLREQREVDVRDVLAELIHYVFELDAEIEALAARVDRPEPQAGAEG